MNFLDTLKPLLIKHEGFLPKPVWDVKQWSWGYGSFAGSNPAAKPAGTITKEQAWREALSHIQNHYKELSRHLKVALNSNQWAALISFSYNLGVSTGKKMVGYINTKNPSLIKHKWGLYVIADGKRSAGLVKRRADEYALFAKPATGSMMPNINPAFIGVLLLTIYFITR